MFRFLKKMAVLLCMAIVLNRCCKENFCFKWTGFSLVVMDNSGRSPVVASGDSVREKALCLQVLFEDSIWSVAYQKIGLCEQAHATTCAERFAMVNTIRMIKIYTVYDLNSNYPANSDVTALFRARQHSRSNELYSRIEEVIGDVNSAARARTNDSRHNEDIELYLLNNEKMRAKCRFRVLIDFSDQTSLENETTDIILY